MQILPADSDSPVSIISETFRTELIRRVIEIKKVTIFREMTPIEQISAVAGGTLVGLVAVAFHFTEDQPRSRDHMMEVLQRLLEAAGKVAEENM